jgi:hypothetical protein
MKRSTVVWLGIVVLLGVVGIGVGWAIEGNTIRLHGAAHTFVPGLLADIGTALLLGVFFLVVQRSVSSQIQQAAQDVRREVDDVRDEVRQTANRLSELTAETASLLTEARDRDSAMARAIEEDASFEAVADLLRRGTELGAVSGRGLRVAMAHGERLRFRLVSAEESAGGPPAPMIWLEVEGPYGTERHVSAIWSAGEGFPAVLVRLAEEMKRQAVFPGDSVFDATSLLSGLVETLEFAIHLRENPRGDMHQLGAMIERINDEWALTKDGLEHLSKPPYAMQPSQLLDDAHFREHMLDKTWVISRQDEFEDAWDLARRYYERSRGAR